MGPVYGVGKEGEKEMKPKETSQGRSNLDKRTKAAGNVDRVR